MNFKEINLEKELEKLKYYEDSIYLSNVIPFEIARFFGKDERDLDIIGGRDLDYEAIFGKYCISGSALYGSCEITLVNAKRKPKELIEKELNEIEYKKYKATSFEKNGRITKNVPPVRDNVSKEELTNLIQKGILKAFYLFPYVNSPYTIFYAKDEWDARLRAIAIWGSYNNIYNEEKMNETIEHYKNYPESMKPKQNKEMPMFILDWEYKKES